MRCVYEGGVFYRPLRVMYSVYPTGTSSLTSTRRARLEPRCSKEASPCCREFSGTSRFQEHSLLDRALNSLSLCVCVNTDRPRLPPPPGDPLKTDTSTPLQPLHPRTPQTCHCSPRWVACFYPARLRGLTPCAHYCASGASGSGPIDLIFEGRSSLLSALEVRPKLRPMPASHRRVRSAARSRFQRRGPVAVPSPAPLS